MIAAGDRLRDLREDKGKTQAEISSLLGTTQQIYSRYETNRTLQSVPLVSLQAVPRFQFCFSICKGNLFFQFLAHRIAF